ncbi:hypothetical protein HAX54_037044, partial [Datura stramonium]|nr:hypothetical protein [Datura stramonium]
MGDLLLERLSSSIIIINGGRIDRPKSRRRNCGCFEEEHTDKHCCSGKGQDYCELAFDLFGSWSQSESQFKGHGTTPSTFELTRSKLKQDVETNSIL